MVALKIFFGSECRRSNSAPPSLGSLKDYIFSITGLINPTILYQDDENDWISICTESEYEEFLIGSSQLLKLTVSPGKSEQSSGPIPLKNEDFASMTVPFTSDQKIGVEVITVDKSQSTPVRETHDSECSPQELISKITETVPLVTSSIKVGTAEVLMMGKYTNTKLDLLESIRGIIREELSRGEQLKLSGIMHKHVGVVCSRCKADPIVGIRYKCSECPVNLCESCEYSSDHEHPFFKVKQPIGEIVEVIKPAEYKISENIGVVHKTESKMFEVLKEKLKVEEKKVEEKKVEEKKVEEKKVEEIKVEEKKVEEKKVVEQKVEEKKPEGKNGIYEENIEKLKGMGFLQEQVCLKALVACNNHLESAVEYILYSS